MELNTLKKSLVLYAGKAAEYATAARQAVCKAVSGLAQRDYTARDAVILFVLALCLGAAVKWAAHDRLTIGFQDYTLAPAGKIIDINAAQKHLIENGGSFSLSGPASGKACSE